MLPELVSITQQLGTDNDAFDGATVMLVGANGFLGRLFQAYFHHIDLMFRAEGREGCTVIAVDNGIVGRVSDGFFPAIDLDITNKADIEDLAFERADYIINLAGLASPRLYQKYPLETVRVSVQGTDNLLALARYLDVKGYLACSSSEIYGDPTVVPTPETYLGGVETFCERGCYDHGKLMLENLCYIYNTRYGVPTKVIRPFNIIGFTANDGRVIPNQVSRLLRGEKLKVFAPGTQTRTFCWFSDFIIGTIKVLLHGGPMPYNIGNDQNEISMVDLARKLESIAGLSNMVELIEPTEVYKTEPMRRCPDISKARRELGYEPRVSLDRALPRFWNWAQANYTA